MHFVWTVLIYLFKFKWLLLREVCVRNDLNDLNFPNSDKKSYKGLKLCSAALSMLSETSN